MSNFTRSLKLMKYYGKAFKIYGVLVIILMMCIVVMNLCLSADTSGYNATTYIVAVSVCYISVFDTLIGNRVSASSGLRKYIVTKFSVILAASMVGVIFGTDILSKLIGGVINNSDMSILFSSTTAAAVSAALILAGFGASYFHPAGSVIMIVGYLPIYSDMISLFTDDPKWKLSNCFIMNNYFLEILLVVLILVAGLGIFALAKNIRYRTVSTNACRTLASQSDEKTAVLFGIR